MAWDTPEFTIYVIRHGHRADKEPTYDGGQDTPLSERGHEQAEALARRMAEVNLDAMYSSCQLRALQTAAPVHRETDVPWHAWPVFGEFANKTWLDLARSDSDAAGVATWQTNEPIDGPGGTERDQVDGEYYLLSEIPDRFPDVSLDQPFPYPDAWWLAGDDDTRTNGIARLELGAQALLHRHEEDERIAVVCHTQSGAGLVSTIMDEPYRHRFRRHSFDNAAITRLDRRETGDWLLRYANRIEHIPPELRN